MSKRARANKNLRTLIIVIAAIVIVAIVALCLFKFLYPEKWAALFGQEQLSQGDGELLVHFFDVGQGDSIYIEFPDGDDMLIDCGSTKGCSESAALSYIEKYNDDGVINHLMLTHTDQDHVEYLDAVIEKYQIENIYMPNVLATPTGASKYAEELRQQIGKLPKEKLDLFTDEDAVGTNTYAIFFVAALSEPDCAIHLNMDDDEFSNNIVIADDENTYKLTFYCPTKQYYEENNLKSSEKLNAVSPVGILEYNGRRVVFTGDSNKINEPIVASRINFLDCDVLKVAHHGSETSSTSQFLAAVRCEYAVISCGEGNDYRHPRQDALDRLQAYNMTVYRTDKNGEIILSITAVSEIGKRGEMKFTTEKAVDQKENYIGGDKQTAER